MHKIKRALALVLCCMLLLSSAAYAETKAYTVKKTTVYKQEDGKPVKAGTIPKGTELTVLDVQGSWALVEKDGYQGYVKKSALKEAGISAEPAQKDTSASDITTCKKTVYVAVDGTKAYSDASESSKVLITLDAGTKLTMTAYNDEWCRVKKGSKNAYIKRSNLSLSKVAATVQEKEDEPTESSNVTTCSETVYIAVSKATVYQSASTSSKKLGTLKEGTSLKMTAYTDDWCRVVSGDNTGYIRRKDLTLEKPAEEAKEPAVTECKVSAYVRADGTKVYESTSTSSDVLTKLDQNTKVTVTGYTDEWCRVKNGSRVGYIVRSALSDSKVDEETAPTQLQYGDTGEYVTKMQEKLKDLGYFSGSCGGNYLEQTKTAVALFQSQNGLTSTGTADSATLKKLFSDSAVKYTAPAKEEKQEEKEESASGGSTAKPASGHSVMVDWFTGDIQSVFSRGTVAVVTDCSTGISWREKRTGGYNHADCQPLTAADTAAMKSAAGSWSWKRRAVWVSIGSKKYAASMNCMPHGSGSIKDNNFNGHHCIHFTNSRTHGTNRVCPLHQAAIKEAYNKG